MLISLDAQMRDGRGLVRATSIDVEALARNLSARLAHSAHYLLHGAGRTSAPPDLLDFIEACRLYDLTLIPRFQKESGALHGLMVKFDEQHALAASQIVYLRERAKTESMLSMLADRGIALPESEERMSLLRALAELPYQDLLLNRAPTSNEVRKVGQDWFRAALDGRWLEQFETRKLGGGAGDLVVLRSNEYRYDSAASDFVPKRHNKVLSRHADGSYDKISYDNITTFRPEILSGIDDPSDIPELIGEGIAIWGMPTEPDQTERDAAPRRRLKDFQMRTFGAAEISYDPSEIKKAVRTASNLFWSMPHQDRAEIVDAMERGGMSFSRSEGQLLRGATIPVMGQNGFPRAGHLQKLMGRIFDPAEGVRFEVTKALLPSIVRPPQGNSVFFVDMDKLPLSVIQEGLTLDAFVRDPAPHLRNLIDRQFPPEFRDVRFGAKFSSSMGLSKADGLQGEFAVSTDDDQFSVHLFFVLETPVPFDGLMHHIHAHQRDVLLPSLLEERLERRDLSAQEAQFCRAIIAAAGDANRTKFIQLADAYLNGDLPQFDPAGRLQSWAKLTDADRKAHRRSRSGIAHIDMAMKSPNQPFFGAVTRCTDAQTGAEVPTALEVLGGRKLVSVDGSRPTLSINRQLVMDLAEHRGTSTRATLRRETSEIYLRRPSQQPEARRGPSSAEDLDLARILQPVRDRHANQIGGVDSFNAPLFRYAVAAWGQLYRELPDLPLDWSDPNLTAVRAQLLEMIKQDIRKSVDRGADPAKANQYATGKFEQDSFHRSWEFAARSADHLAIDRKQVDLAVLREHFRHQDSGTRRSLLSAFLARTEVMATQSLNGGLRKTPTGETVLFDIDPKSGAPKAMMVVETTEVLRVADDRNSHVFFHPSASPCAKLRVHGDIDSAMKHKGQPTEAIAVAVMAGDDQACTEELKAIVRGTEAKVIVVDDLAMQKGVQDLLGDTEKSVELRPVQKPKLQFPKNAPVSRSLPNR